AENIALLSILSRAPTPSQGNPRPSTEKDAGRLLSFRQEQRLAEVLAFISGISDDPTRVVALCVEELAIGKGIRVVIAINKTGPESGSDILQRIQNGLKNLFSHLAQVNDENSAMVEPQILNAISDMCENRILGRISSKRLGADYGKQGKTFLGTAIQQAADAVRKYGDKKRFGPAIEKFLRDAAGLQRRLTRLEACETGDVPSHIGEVIRACHQLNKTTNFDEFFSGITTRQLDPSSKKYLTTRLSKLARYQECFLYLLKSAKAYGIFEQVDVTAVSPEPEFFSKFNLPANRSLTGCLSRCQNGASVIFGAKAISKKLNLKLDIITREFTSTIEKVQQGSRVHAEVQIVSHYELHPAAKMPRIICSSKNACYLCNLFIQLHGAFYIPRTHGNLYFRWRMLSIPSLSQLQAQLNSALEARIRVALQSIMAASNPRRVLAPNENESAIFPFSRSMSLVASSLLLSQAASKRNSAGTSTDEPPAEQETQPSSPELPLQPLKPALRPESNNMTQPIPAIPLQTQLSRPPLPVPVSPTHHRPHLDLRSCSPLTNPPHSSSSPPPPPPVAVAGAVARTYPPTPRP
ncbi:hypothetical protein N656DRAFT_692707, partial [Canariomyces notabilis]